MGTGQVQTAAASAPPEWQSLCPAFAACDGAGGARGDTRRAGGPASMAFATAAAGRGEGSGGQTVEIVATNPPGYTHPPSGDGFTWRVAASGTASLGSDFQMNTPVVISNHDNGTIGYGFTLTVLQDTADEPDETVVVELVNPTGDVVIGSPATYTLTIQDDDVASADPVHFVPAATSHGESGSQLVFTAGTGVGTGSYTVEVAGGTATPGVDFSVPSAGQPVPFGAGDTSKNFPVNIVADTEDEPNETVVLRLTNATGDVVLGPPTEFTLTIEDDDDPAPAPGENEVRFVGSAVTVTEGDGGKLTLQRPLGTAEGFVGTRGVAGTAKLGDDWLLQGGGDAASVEFLPATRTGEVTFTSTEDTVAEPTETFTVQLENPSGTLKLAVPSTVTVTVLDDDSAPGGGQTQGPELVPLNPNRPPDPPQAPVNPGAPGPPATFPIVTPVKRTMPDVRFMTLAEAKRKIDAVLGSAVDFGSVAEQSSRGTAIKDIKCSEGGDSPPSSKAACTRPGGKRLAANAVFKQSPEAGAEFEVSLVKAKEVRLFFRDPLDERKDPPDTRKYGDECPFINTGKFKEEAQREFLRSLDGLSEKAAVARLEDRECPFRTTSTIQRGNDPFTPYVSGAARATVVLDVKTDRIAGAFSVPRLTVTRFRYPALALAFSYRRLTGSDYLAGGTTDAPRVNFGAVNAGMTTDGRLTAIPAGGDTNDQNAICVRAIVSATGQAIEASIDVQDPAGQPVALKALTGGTLRPTTMPARMPGGELCGLFAIRDAGDYLFQVTYQGTNGQELSGGARVRATTRKNGAVATLLGGREVEYVANAQQFNLRNPTARRRGVLEDAVVAVLRAVQNFFAGVAGELAKPAVAVQPRPVRVADTLGLRPSVLVSGLIANDGASLVGNAGGTLLANDGASLIANDGASLIANDGGSLIANDGASLIANDGSSLIANDGASIVSNHSGARSARPRQAAAGSRIAGLRPTASGILSVTSGTTRQGALPQAAGITALGGSFVVAGGVAAQVGGKAVPAARPQVVPAGGMVTEICDREVVFFAVDGVFRFLPGTIIAGAALPCPVNAGAAGIPVVRTG
ncbi:hypothetical protein DSM112329_03231 [Paraconexibacter sp. AEG42_29]|uniref:Calx-beta domain-containing protein n=2 Tax=Paraconexibacter sp. AEG42_29 TaxID=2997339 RepID=A0AAU7AYG5_9ACTN